MQHKKCLLIVALVDMDCVLFRKKFEVGLSISVSSQKLASEIKSSQKVNRPFKRRPMDKS